MVTLRCDQQGWKALRESLDPRWRREVPLTRGNLSYDLDKDEGNR